MLPIKRELINTDLTIEEKVSYIKARCLIAQLNRLNSVERNDYSKGDIEKLFKDAEDTIKAINKKLSIDSGLSLKEEFMLVNKVNSFGVIR